MPSRTQPAVGYDADGIALKGAQEVLVENCLVERCDLLGELKLPRPVTPSGGWQWSLQLILLRSTTFKIQGTGLVSVLLAPKFEALLPKAHLVWMILPAWNAVALDDESADDERMLSMEKHSGLLLCCMRVSGCLSVG